MVRKEASFFTRGDQIYEKKRKKKKKLCLDIWDPIFNAAVVALSTIAIGTIAIGTIAIGTIAIGIHGTNFARVLNAWAGIHQALLLQFSLLEEFSIGKLPVKD